MVVNGDNIFKGIIIAFVAVIIGLAFFGSIVNTTGELTRSFSVENRTFTAVNNTDVSFNLSTEVPVAISEVRNNDSVVLILGSNYTSNVSAGTISMNVTYAAEHGVVSQSGWEVDFSFQSPDYIDDSASRSITNLIPIFFALAILSAAFLAVKFDMFDGFGKNK